MRLSAYCALAALLLLLLFTPCADATPQPPKLGLCGACHGENGHASTPQIPNLAGQNLDYLRSAIAQYRSGARNIAAMRTALGMLNAAEVDAVLQWYAQSPPQPPPAP